MSYRFDANYFLPFPTLPVVIRNPQGGAITPELRAYKDTGADATIVPARQLAVLRRETARPARLRSQWGEVQMGLIYVVDLEVGGHLLPGIEIVVDTRGHEVLLGRNVLNLLILLLDGPHGLTDILSRRPARIR